MKVFISKYALTVGIQEVDDADINEHYPRSIRVPSLGVFASFHGEGKEWHRTLESAKNQAEQMRVAKIKSLKNQIAKLGGMSF